MQQQLFRFESADNVQLIAAAAQAPAIKQWLDINPPHRHRDPVKLTKTAVTYHQPSGDLVSQCYEMSYGPALHLRSGNCTGAVFAARCLKFFRQRSSINDLHACKATELMQQTVDSTGERLLDYPAHALRIADLILSCAIENSKRGA